MRCSTFLPSRIEKKNILLPLGLCPAPATKVVPSGEKLDRGESSGHRCPTTLFDELNLCDPECNEAATVGRKGARVGPRHCRYGRALPQRTREILA